MNIHLKNSLELSSLEVSEETGLAFEKKISSILGMINKIDNFSSKSMEVLQKGQSKGLKEDKIKESIDVKEIKKMTKYFLDGYFKVPKVME